MRNIVSARGLLTQYGFVIRSEQVSGGGHRCVSLDLASGGVWERHTA